MLNLTASRIFQILACAAWLTALIVDNACNAQDRAPSSVPAVKYFLDEKPDSEDIQKLPSPARQVLIAKVKALSTIYVGGRDGVISSKDQFFARLRVLEIIFGDASEASEIGVFFGAIGVPNIKYPHTPSMLEREYFVVSYVGEDGRRRLLGYPIAHSEYEQWDAERLKYERSR